MHKSMNAWRGRVWLALAAAVIVTGPADCRAQARSSGAATAPGSQAVLRLEAILAGPTELEFVEAPLADVARYLAEFSQCTVLVDEPGLVDSGLDLNSLALTGTFRDLSLGAALYHLLRPHGLSFGISHEALVITSEDEAASLLYVRCYPLGDLVERWPNSAAGLGAEGGGMGFFQVTENMAGMADMGGVTEGLFVSRPAGEELLELITACVTPDSWDCNGGEGAIAYAPPARMLVVDQTYAVHAELSTLLQQLAAAVVANPVPEAVETPLEGAIE